MKETVCDRPYSPEYDYMMEESLFNPHHYIQLMDDGYALCTNPLIDGGLSAITVNTNLGDEALRNFEASIKRMVLSKLFSPKFAEVILTATQLGMTRRFP